MSKSELLVPNRLLNVKPVFTNHFFFEFLGLPKVLTRRVPGGGGAVAGSGGGPGRHPLRLAGAARGRAASPLCHVGRGRTPLLTLCLKKAFDFAEDILKSFCNKPSEFINFVF